MFSIYRNKKVICQFDEDNIMLLVEQIRLEYDSLDSNCRYSVISTLREVVKLRIISNVIYRKFSRKCSKGCVYLSNIVKIET